MTQNKYTFPVAMAHRLIETINGYFCGIKSGFQ
jgi:hypothetical protein